MKNFDANNEMVGKVNCAVCEHAILGGRWFARIRSGGYMVALCCPLCEETFMKKPGAYVLRIESYEKMGVGK